MPGRSFIRNPATATTSNNSNPPVPTATRRIPARFVIVKRIPIPARDRDNDRTADDSLAAVPGRGATVGTVGGSRDGDGGNEGEATGE
ncbi:MAG: hypothetical protein KBD39_05990 [Sterolibacterium sp.]|nr:hypothetical protein [Sterolibacterium sp.]MBP9799653.1 hypothetical protein [Sterolibacterium sp.]